MSYILPHANVETWSSISEVLGKKIHQTDELTSTIGQLACLTNTSIEGTMAGLTNAIARWNCSENLGDFFEVVLPIIQAEALKLPQLFPVPQLKRLSATQEREVSEQLVELTESEISCLLANMFFCTLAPQPPMKYWANFGVWFSSKLDPVQEYLVTLFRYFYNINRIELSNKPSLHKVVFIRRRISKASAPSWHEIDRSLKLPEIEVKIEGGIGDYVGESIEIDFANKDPGYGCGGTQEEIFFGFMPEMCVCVLICDSLEDEDVLVIRGARRVSNYVGYGLDVKVQGTLIPLCDSKPRYVVAMDALNFDYGEYDDPFIERTLLLRQLDEHIIQREFHKAYNGFMQSAVVPTPHVIETGNWGCGAFAGNPDLKAVIQILAATSARCKQLIFYCFGDREQAERLKNFIDSAKLSNEQAAYCIAAIRCIKAIVESSKRSDAMPQLLSLPTEKILQYMQ